MAHHDTLADLKAYFDGNMQSSKSFDEKNLWSTICENVKIIYLLGEYGHELELVSAYPQFPSLRKVTDLHRTISQVEVE